MDLLQQAQKEEHRWSLFDNKQKYETAADLYEQAGNRFKMDVDHKAAADAYVKAGELYQRSQRSSYYITKMYLEAGKQFKYFDYERALIYFSKVKELYELRGDFVKTAEILEEMAVVDESQAITCYNKAIEYYTLGNNFTKANKTRLKLCERYLENKNYSESAILFETVGNTSDSKLSWIKMEHYSKALICWLALDEYDLAERKLKEYSESDPKILSHYKYKHFQEINQACVSGEVQRFVNAVYELDQRATLEPWMAVALLQVKNNLMEMADNIL